MKSGVNIVNNLKWLHLVIITLIGYSVEAQCDKVYLNTNSAGEWSFNTSCSKEVRINVMNATAFVYSQWEDPMELTNSTYSGNLGDMTIEVVGCVDCVVKVDGVGCVDSSFETCGGVFPVTYKYIKIDNSRLEWATEVEVNHSHFEVEVDYGSGFFLYKKIRHYSVVLPNQNLFVRLKQVDLDGNYTYSEVLFHTKLKIKPKLLFKYGVFEVYQKENKRYGKIRVD